jgi:hypothetical protein
MAAASLPTAGEYHGLAPETLAPALEEFFRG